MKNIIFTVLILSLCGSVMAFENTTTGWQDYLTPDYDRVTEYKIPQRKTNNIQYKVYMNEPLQLDKQTYNINKGSRVGNTYYSTSGTGYTRQGNNIYGSDGSQYTQFGSTIQNNATGKTYQINNNLVTPIN